MEREARSGGRGCRAVPMGCTRWFEGVKRGKSSKGAGGASRGQSTNN